ncbi:MAG: hypothetical protein LBI61_00635 [Puniceicoccales bacterium]|jgi:hypothetical protein|nr:hypothetical protein [Puniceicoccales bacterium]
MGEIATNRNGGNRVVLARQLGLSFAHVKKQCGRRNILGLLGKFEFVVGRSHGVSTRPLGMHKVAIVEDHGARVYGTSPMALFAASGHGFSDAQMRNIRVIPSR